MATRRYTSKKSTFRSGSTYAPVSKAKFAREVVGTKEYLPSPAETPRAAQYYEARKQPIKHAYKLAERNEVPPPRPQRVKAPRKPEISSSDATTKPAEKTNKQETVETVLTAKVPDKESKNASAKPTAESNEEVPCELTNLMASILQDELEQIMIEVIPLGKVWQELPDDPPTEAEDLVANKFRNEAGDDLQNAMGLNVTARLLNVHNPLYAKLQFSGKPEAGCLQAFISEYKISAFKRIADSSRDLFAARFDHIADFDKLCVHSEVKCGSATVAIIPCYKYFSNPPALKSIYADNIAKTNKPLSTYGPQKPSDIDKKDKNVENAEAKTDNENYVDKNIIEKETSKQSNTTPTKTVTATNANVATKAVVNKTVVQVKPKSPEKIENKVNSNGKQVKTDSIDEMMVVDKMGDEDDEEMTDQDILALMSGGIVLDECSGSDEEK